jgi:hypothetical protein
MSAVSGLDIDTRDLLSRAHSLLKWPDDAGVLVVGSRAECVSQDSSNINILVLGHTASWLTDLQHAGATIRPMTLLDNAIVHVRDAEVSLEIVGEQTRDRLAEVMESVVVLDDPGREKLELPALDLFELRLMARLESGIVLQRGDVVRQWRRALRVDRFRSYYVACTYLVAQHYLRKSLTSAIDGDELGAVLRSNTAAEHLAYSALASYGHLLHDSKNLGRHVSAVLQREPNPPTVLHELGSLLTTGADRIQIRSTLLRDWSAQLLAAISTDASLADAYSFLTGGGDD